MSVQQCSELMGAPEKSVYKTSQDRHLAPVMMMHNRTRGLSFKRLSFVTHTQLLARLKANTQNEKQQTVIIFTQQSRPLAQLGPPPSRQLYLKSLRSVRRPVLWLWFSFLTYLPPRGRFFFVSLSLSVSHYTMHLLCIRFIRQAAFRLLHKDDLYPPR